MGIVATSDASIRTASIVIATAEGFARVTDMVERPPADFILMPEGFVHALADLMRIAEGVERMTAGSMATAEATAHAPDDFARVLHDVA